ncbi:LysR family transcriptional regulator, partial [Streptomyces noursei]
TRARALEALEGQGRQWRIACTSGSLNGLIAATRAGLGVMAHALGMIPPGLVRIPARAGLPELGGVDFALLYGERAGAARGPAEAPAEAILAGGDRLQMP